MAIKKSVMAVLLFFLLMPAMVSGFTLDKDILINPTQSNTTFMFNASVDLDKLTVNKNNIIINSTPFSSIATNPINLTFYKFNSTYQLFNLTNNTAGAETTITSGGWNAGIAVFIYKNSILNATKTANSSGQIEFTTDVSKETEWLLYVDTTPPNIILNFPANDSWNTSNIINFGFTPTTNDDFVNCSL